MKLEEVLPEIRKGRRFRQRTGGERFISLGQSWAVVERLSDLIEGNWELEPIPEQKIEVTKEDVRIAFNRIDALRYIPKGELDGALEQLWARLGFNEFRRGE